MPISRAITCSHREHCVLACMTAACFNRSMLFGAVVNLERERIAKRRWTSNTSGAQQKSARLVVHVSRPFARDASRWSKEPLISTISSRYLLRRYSQLNTEVTSCWLVSWTIRVSLEAYVRQDDNTTACIPRPHHNSFGLVRVVPSFKQTINHQSSTLPISFGWCKRNMWRVCRVMLCFVLSPTRSISSPTQPCAELRHGGGWTGDTRLSKEEACQSLFSRLR